MKYTLKYACLFFAGIMLLGCGQKTSDSVDSSNTETDDNKISKEPIIDEQIIDEPVDEDITNQQIIDELTTYDWINLYRGTFIYEFEKDGSYQVYAYRDESMESSDSWIPTAEKMEIIPNLEGIWKLDGNEITLTYVASNKEIKAEVYFKGSKDYDTYNKNGYTGNSFIYESSYVEPEKNEGPLTTSAFHLLRLGEKEEKPETAAVPLNNWRGVYIYDDGSYGEILIVKASDDKSVTGQYIYSEANGEYNMRDFTWETTNENPCQAKEPFQNGTDYVYYEAGNNEITVKYPEGWYEDRSFIYRSSVEDMMNVVTHPMLGNQPTASTPFYGIWTMGSKAESDATQAADELKALGFDAKVYMTTNWSNLNPEPWFVVSAGEYASENEADNALSAVQNAGYSDAYVKYTGEYIQ